jgi:single-stranded DNA-binding protein
MSGDIEVALTGVCARNPELKHSVKSGKPFCQFSLAVGDGDARQWVRVCCFAETAERVAAQLRKGGKAYIEGLLEVGIWQPDGKPPQVNMNVSARRVEILGQIGRNRPPKPQQQTDSRGRLGSHAQHERPFDDAPFDEEVAT